MASDEARLALLSAGTRTPIAQLSPELPEQASRAVCGHITIIWPYNSVTKTPLSFLPSPMCASAAQMGKYASSCVALGAEAVAGIGCGGGDEILLSLDGATWATDESARKVPGAQLGWQLQFLRKASLQVRARLRHC